MRGDLIVYVSDNESWCDSRGGSRGYGLGFGYSGQGTATLREFEIFKRRNPKARMVCIDLAANVTTQAQERDDVMNIGGFSDEVFKVIGRFAAGGSVATDDASLWVSEIKAIDVNALGVES